MYRQVKSNERKTSFTSKTINGETRRFEGTHYGGTFAKRIFEKIATT